MKNKITSTALKQAIAKATMGLNTPMLMKAAPVVTAVSTNKAPKINR